MPDTDWTILDPPQTLEDLIDQGLAGPGILIRNDYDQETLIGHVNAYGGACGSCCTAKCQTIVAYRQVRELDLSILDRQRLAAIIASRIGREHGLVDDAQALSWALHELWMRIHYVEGPFRELGKLHDLGPATRPEVDEEPESTEGT